jgi:hypothetical protein
LIKTYENILLELNEWLWPTFKNHYANIICWNFTIVKISTTHIHNFMKTTCKFIQKCFQHMFINNNHCISVKIYVHCCYLSFGLGTKVKQRQKKNSKISESKKRTKTLKKWKEAFLGFSRWTLILGIGNVGMFWMGW